MVPTRRSRLGDPQTGIGIVALCAWLVLIGRANLEAEQTVGAQGGFVVVPPDGAVRGAPPGGAPPRDQVRRPVPLASAAAWSRPTPASHCAAPPSGSCPRRSVSRVDDDRRRRPLRVQGTTRRPLHGECLKGSYASLSYGQTRPNEPGRPIALSDNQTIEKIDLRLPRGGVITGVVTDELRRPVPDAMVTPFGSSSSRAAGVCCRPVVTARRMTSAASVSSVCRLARTILAVVYRPRDGFQSGPTSGSATRRPTSQGRRPDERAAPDLGVGRRSSTSTSR